MPAPRAHAWPRCHGRTEPAASHGVVSDTGWQTLSMRPEGVERGATTTSHVLEKVCPLGDPTTLVADTDRQMHHDIAQPRSAAACCAARCLCIKTAMLAGRLCGRPLRPSSVSSTVWPGTRPGRSRCHPRPITELIPTSDLTLVIQHPRILKRKRAFASNPGGVPRGDRQSGWLRGTVFG